MIGSRSVFALAFALAPFGVTGCGEEPPEIPAPVFSQETEPTVVDAIEDTRRRVARDPDSPEAWGWLGHALLAHGYEAEAEIAYRRAAALEPESFAWPYYLGRSLESRDPAAAADAFARSVEKEPGYAPALAERARALTRIGEHDAAAAVLERLVAIAPESPVPHLLLGEVALATDRPEEARDHLERAVAIAPEYSEAHRALARAHLALGAREAAERHAEWGEAPTRYRALSDTLWTRVRLSAATRRAFAERGRLLLARGEHAAAAEQLERAVTDEEATPLLRLNLGLAMIGAGRYGEAVDVLERAAREAEADSLAPDERVALWTALGSARAGAGETAAAETAVRRALELDPRSAEALVNLALVLHLDGRTGEAIRLLEESGVEAPAIDRMSERLRAAPRAAFGP